MKAIVIKDVNLLSETSVSYPVETISEIVHGSTKIITPEKILEVMM